MEEFVGKLWHRYISRSAQQGYPEQAVNLGDLHKTIGILFRASGGEGGLRIEATNATEHTARRSMLQRLAGSGDKIELCWRTRESLYLPARIDAYPERSLNRDLYLWLTVLAAESTAKAKGDWFADNQWLTTRVLRRYPGIRERYRRLVEAELGRRPDPAKLSDEEAAQERARVAARAAEESREALEQARLRYRTGTAPITELLDEHRILSLGNGGSPKSFAARSRPLSRSTSDIISTVGRYYR